MTCNVDAHTVSIRTRCTDNLTPLAIWNNNVYTLQPNPAYVFATATHAPFGANQKDDITHRWTNPAADIPAGTVFHVGVELDVWDWTAVNGVAFDASLNSCVLPLTTGHDWGNVIASTVAAAEALDDGLTTLPSTNIVLARGFSILSSEAPLHRISNLQIADVSGMGLTLSNLNRRLLFQLQTNGQIMTVSNFGIRTLSSTQEFVVVLQGDVSGLPTNIRSNGNYLILNRPDLLDRQLFAYWQSANDESTMGNFGLLGQAPLVSRFFPVLSIRPVADEHSLLCWPYPSAGWVLQCTTNLNPASWQPVSLPIAIVNNQKCVTIDTHGGSAFYRLCQPTNLAITELSYNQTNIVQQCETVFLTATGFSPNKAPLTFTWLVLGTPAGANFTFTTNANSASFVSQTVGTYALEVKLTDNLGHTDVRTFTITVVPGPLCSLQPGQDTVKIVSVAASNVTGAPFPPFAIAVAERNEDTVPRIPNGPLLGNLQPSAEGVDVSFPIPALALAGQQFTNDPVVFGRSTGYGTNVSFSGVPPDMSGAAGTNNVVLTSGNTWGALSTDGGLTFRALDPTRIFPSAPSRDAAGNLLDGGLCCDQVIQYVPQIDRYIWLMQFWRAPSGPNMLRIASASTAQLINSGGTAWTYWNLRSSTFGLGNNWMDYPDMSVGNNYLYISVDDVGHGLLVMRIPLSQIQASATINIDYTNPDNSAAAYGGHLTQRTGDTIFWAGHNSTSQMRIWSLAEGSGVYSWRDVSINSWPNGSRTSLTPSGVDWLNFGFPGAACIGAARRFPTGGPSEIWFAWTAGQGGGFAHPHIQIARFNASNFAFLGQVQVWNGSHGYAYPALVSNTREDVGMAVAFGGGGIFEASSAVGIWGDFVVYTPGFSTSSLNRWGDYLTVRPFSPKPGVYDASVYNRVNLGSGDRFNPVYIRFGRQSVGP